MTQAGSVYGEALYDLAKEEHLAEEILGQIGVLADSFRENPDFIRLLSAANLSKDQRCEILDESFREKIHPYVLNFLKILTQKGYIGSFADCVQTYRELYNRDNGILPVDAVSAVALTAQQKEKLTAKLSSLTGKKICLTNRVEPGVLGGIRLDYDGKSLDDTVSHRLDAVRSLLKNTVI